MKINPKTKEALLIFEAYLAKACHYGGAVQWRYVRDLMLNGFPPWDKLPRLPNNYPWGDVYSRIQILSLVD